MSVYTIDTVHDFMIAQDLLTADDFLFHDYEVTSMNRRNRNLQITTLHKKDYLVKQVFDKTADNAKTLSIELQFYEHITQQLPHLQHLFPKAKYTSKEQILLVLEFYKEAIPLWKYYKQKGIQHFPLITVAAAGNMLGSLHKAFAEDRSPRLSFLSDDLPFIFDLHRPHPKLLSYLHPGGYRFLEDIQADEQLMSLWNIAREQWEVNSLIHGDIKLDNVIVLPAEETQDAVDLKIIDWEMAQYGDRAFDIAGGLQDFIFWWAIMMPDKDSAQEMIQNAPFSFNALHPAVAAYWEGYRNAFEISKEEAASLLKKAVFYSGFRCLQTTYEISSKFDNIPPIATILLNLGKSIIKDPVLAQQKLFGLP